MEKKQESAIIREELRDRKVACNENSIREIQEKLDKLVAEKSNKAVFRELGERARKENNLVLHMVPESTSKDAGARKQHNLQALGELIGYLEVNIKVDKAVKFCRRQGAIPDSGSKPRPLLVGFKRKEDMDLVLQSAKHLSDCPDKLVAKISIVRDLTKAQRDDEADLLEEVKRKNLSRTEEDITNNQCYKRVGKRGERYEIKVTLRSTETIDPNGLVVDGDAIATGANAVSISYPGQARVFGQAGALAGQGRGGLRSSRGLVRPRPDSDEEGSSPKRRSSALSLTADASDKQDLAEANSDKESGDDPQQVQVESGDSQPRGQVMVPTKQVFSGLADIRGEHH